MIKSLLISILICILCVALVTCISPALGYQVTVLVGTLISQPLLAALKLGLLIRGLV